MYIVGLTGGIATGKTTVAQLIKQIDSSIVVVDFDAISREVVQIGKPAYNMIVKTFGKEILDPEGNIDRKKLGAVMLSLMPSIFSSKKTYYDQLQLHRLCSLLLKHAGNSIKSHIHIFSCNSLKLFCGIGYKGPKQLF